MQIRAASSRRFMLIVVASVAALCVLLPATASARWMPISAGSGANTDDPGVVRGSDGTLHVAWREGAAIRYRTLPRSGAKWGTPSTVVDGWASLGSPDVELVGNVPHVFWGGQGTTDAADPTSSGRGWYATLSGSTWNRSANPMTERQSVSASTQVSTALASDGTPWMTWTGTSLLAIDAGLDMGAEETNLAAEGCCEYAANVARDAATGDLYLVWYSNATGGNGVYTRRIAPALGDTMRLPSIAGADSFLSRVNRLAAAARTTGGVYSAYCETYPTCTRIRVAGSSGPSLALRTGRVAADEGEVWTAAAPGGRMWVLWADNNEHVYAARSNRALTRWGAVRSIGAPARTTDTWNVSGDGTLGPLDVVLNATSQGTTRLWHERVAPPLALDVVSMRKDARGRRIVTFRTSDAGDRIRAGVTFRGAVRMTSASGIVRFTVPASVRPGFTGARAISAGYAPATRRVRIP